MAGGIVNSVAGGGGFFAFPALLFTGVPSINANATGTVALWPGTLASTGAYRRALSAELLKRILAVDRDYFSGQHLRLNPSAKDRASHL